MRMIFIGMIAAAGLACVPAECEYDDLYDEGYALGEGCIDWITAWEEEDGLCAADALADGYNDARSDAGVDCDQSPIVVIGPIDLSAASSQ